MCVQALCMIEIPAADCAQLKFSLFVDHKAEKVEPGLHRLLHLPDFRELHVSILARKSRP